MKISHSNVKTIRYIPSHQFLLLNIILCLTIIQGSCKRLIEVDPPINSLNAVNVFTNDATASAVLTNIYSQLSKENNSNAANNSFFSQTTITNIGYYTALYSDELTLLNINNNNQLLPQYYLNDLTNSSGDFWKPLYRYIFLANSAMEGLSNSTTLTPSIKGQLMGEAKFIRAYCYFYLVNLFEDVPLIISNDWKINSLLERTSKTKVFEQIIKDLQEAEEHLSSDFLKSSNLLETSTERIRPTKWAAAALLSRAYLYIEEWANAEREATKVINENRFSIINLNDVFKKNSLESIWQLQSVYNGIGSNTGEGRIYVLPIGGPTNNSDNPVFLNNSLLSSFESGDKRAVLGNWIQQVLVGTRSYYYSFKYKIGSVNTANQENTMMLRLGEQYLIRSEARAELGDIDGAKSDLNVIRNRAGLSNTTANDKLSLLVAILKERRVELFTEWGHRWLDLKRFSNLESTMNEICRQKGVQWHNFKQLFPIPLAELEKGVNLIQNQGYE